MEMHRALGFAGRARGEADQADIVRRRVEGFEIGRGFAHQRFEPVILRAVEIDDALQGGRQRLGLLHILRQPVIAQAEARSAPC